MAKKKKKKLSSQGFVEKTLSSGVSWPTLAVLVMLVAISINTNVNVGNIGSIVAGIETRLETQLMPLVNANLPLEISKLKLSVDSINKILDSQSDLVNRLSPTQNFFTQAKGIAIINLNPEIEEGLKIFLEKMQDEEFIKIKNSSKSKTQKVIEIVAKIGGIEKLMDLLKTKDRNIAYGVVILFVENHDFKKK